MTIDLTRASQDLLEKGWAVVPSLLSPEELAAARTALEGAVATMREHGLTTHASSVDPNDANVRVYSLPSWDPLFTEMLRHPVARALVAALIGPEAIVSSFTANIAYPGSGSMKIHSDQSLVLPPPWIDPWAINVIWCLDDVHEGNGATRYVPGSHRYGTFDEVPADIADRSVAFEAPAGSLIAMDARVWHTSGENTSADERRAMLFAYYSCDFVRQQVNWEAALSEETKLALDDDARAMFGMGAMANVRIGSKLVRTKADAPKPEFGGVRQLEPGRAG